MPTINKPKKNRNYTKRDKTADIHKYVYNTGSWRTLRRVKLQANPLCEICLESGVITPATCIHHINEISNGSTIEEYIEYGLNCGLAGLMSLCEKCHTNTHKKHLKK